MERQTSFLLHSCPRCSGDLVIRMEDGDGTGTCMQCGNVLYLRRGAQPPAPAAKVLPAAA